MSKPKKLPMTTLSQDAASLNGLRSIKNYKPSRADLSVDALEQSHQRMLAAQRNAIEKEAQQKAAIAEQQAAEQDFHAKVIDMKDSVRGQFGSNSDEIVAVGLKKRSERKPPTKSKKNEKPDEKDTK